MYETLGSGEVDAILDDERIMRCEVQKERSSIYQVRSFVPPAGMSLPFVYPERIAAYVLNDGSSTGLLEAVNRVLERPDIRKRIEAIMKEFLESSDCKA